MKDHLKSFLSLFLLWSSFVSPTFADDKNCLLNGLELSLNQSLPPKIETQEDLLMAFTQGLEPNLAKEEQREAFELYRSKFFGDPKQIIHHGLNDIMGLLRGYPELKKDPFRRFTLTFPKPSYPVTGELRKLADLEIERAQKLIEDIEKGNFSNRLPLAVNIDSSSQKSVDHPFLYGLYKKLEVEYDKALERGDIFSPLAQALTDVIHTMAYLRSDFENRLRAADGLEVLSAFKEFSRQRDQLAKHHTSSKDFDSFMVSLGLKGSIRAPGSEDFATKLARIQSDLIGKRSLVEGDDTVKILRSLSFTESPFRSCLGLDCSSRSYFLKALDPNYYYFTLTDHLGQSNGHVTIVLGEAQGANSQMVKMALVDKVQNVDLVELPLMLEGIRRSVWERGYALARFESLGGETGITRKSATRQFIAQSIPIERDSLHGFKPHPHSYLFQSHYTQADKGFTARAFAPMTLEAGQRINSGRLLPPWTIDQIPTF